MVPVLQNRWKLCGRRLVYFGIRRPPYTLHNAVLLSKRDAAVLAQLDGKKALEEYPIPTLRRLIRQGIVVDRSHYRLMPKTWQDARFCTSCCANDYSIPGLELDEDGRCPLCAGKESWKQYASILPVVQRIPTAKHAQFDSAVWIVR